MSEQDMPQIDLRQIDAIVAYLPLFERQGFKFGEWKSQEGHLAAVLESGHIAAILRRLEQIRGEMRNPARL